MSGTKKLNDFAVLQLMVISEAQAQPKTTAGVIRSMHELLILQSCERWPSCYTCMLVFFQVTCISRSVSSSLLTLFFFSKRLSPLKSASKAVASPGGPSRLGARSVSVEEGEGVKNRQKGFGFSMCFNMLLSFFVFHYAFFKPLNATGIDLSIQKNKLSFNWPSKIR